MNKDFAQIVIKDINGNIINEFTATMDNKYEMTIDVTIDYNMSLNKTQIEDEYDTIAGFWYNKGQSRYIQGRGYELDRSWRQIRVTTDNENHLEGYENYDDDDGGQFKRFNKSKIDGNIHYSKRLKED